MNTIRFCSKKLKACKLAAVLARFDDQSIPKKMKNDGCGEKLVGWFDDNKITWVTILASVAAVQVMCIGISIFIISKVRKLKKIRNNRTVSKRRLYDSSSDDSHDYRHRI